MIAGRLDGHQVPSGEPGLRKFLISTTELFRTLRKKYIFKLYFSPFIKLNVHRKNRVRHSSRVRAVPAEQ